LRRSLSRYYNNGFQSVEKEVRNYKKNHRFAPYKIIWNVPAALLFKVRFKCTGLKPVVTKWSSLWLFKKMINQGLILENPIPNVTGQKKTSAL